jgi:hypothetical protein
MVFQARGPELLEVFGEPKKRGYRSVVCKLRGAWEEQALQSITKRWQGVILFQVGYCLDQKIMRPCLEVNEAKDRHRKGHPA